MDRKKLDDIYQSACLLSSQSLHAAKYFSEHSVKAVDEKSQPYNVEENPEAYACEVEIVVSDYEKTKTKLFNAYIEYNDLYCSFPEVLRSASWRDGEVFRTPKEQTSADAFGAARAFGGEVQCVMREFETEIRSTVHRKDWRMTALKLGELAKALAPYAKAESLIGHLEAGYERAIRDLDSSANLEPLTEVQRRTEGADLRESLERTIAKLREADLGTRISIEIMELWSPRQREVPKLPLPSDSSDSTSIGCFNYRKEDVSVESIGLDRMTASRLGTVSQNIWFGEVLRQAGEILARYDLPRIAPARSETLRVEDPRDRWICFLFDLAQAKKADVSFGDPITWDSHEFVHVDGVPAWKQMKKEWCEEWVDEIPEPVEWWVAVCDNGLIATKNALDYLLRGIPEAAEPATPEPSEKEKEVVTLLKELIVNQQNTNPKTEIVLLPNGTQVEECDVPDEYREGGKSDGEVLTTKHLEGAYDLRGPYISKQLSKGKVLNNYIKVGRNNVYPYMQVRVLRDGKPKEDENDHIIYLSPEEIEKRGKEERDRSLKEKR
jgi:hypothetical protein